MSQQINLLGPMFRRRQVVPSALHVAAGLGSTVLVLGALFAYISYETNTLSQELRSVQGTLKARAAEVGKLKAKVAGKDPALESEVVRLESELTQKRRVLTVLTGGPISSQQGFSEYLRAFSRQALNGLWLTAFTISGAGEITLHGRALDSELLPSYIQRLNREKVMRGRSFSTLEMHRPTAAPTVAAKGKDDTKTARYLEFTLASVEAGENVPPEPKTGRAP